jgi:hypothetical protein
MTGGAPSPDWRKGLGRAKHWAAIGLRRLCQKSEDPTGVATLHSHA